MQSKLLLPAAIGTSAFIAAGGVAWMALYCEGKRFALRDKLMYADAIVSVAGTVGNIKFLDGKVDTAVLLYLQGWAPTILFAGRFSHQATDTPQLMPPEEVESAVLAGRIDRLDTAVAVKTWDVALGAGYMRDRAIRAGVPAAAILTECQSLHTLENAQFTAPMLAERGVQRVILVTSPFHQLRAYLTFANIYRERDIDIVNYAADTSAWHPFTWFLSEENRGLVRREAERIRRYRAKGDLT